MAKRIVILGGGTGGTLMANRLRKVYDPDAVEIAVVDKDDRHVYQPGLLFVPFGLARIDEIVRPRHHQLHKDIVFHESGIDHVVIDDDSVYLADGTVLRYDVLIVATGARLAPEETEGLTGPGWMEKVFTFYTPEGAEALAEALTWFEGGKLVVNIVDMPIKCPVAPIEFAFLADWYLRELGIRDRTRDRARNAPRRLLHEADRLEAPHLPARRERDRARGRVLRGRGGRGGRTARSPTTAGRFPSTCSLPSPCIPAPSTSAARRGWETTSISYPRTPARCSHLRARTSSRSATRPTSPPRRRAL